MFSLSAALLSTLIQQWVRVYMRVYQRSGSPSKKTRIRQYLFEGVKRLPDVAEAPPCLIHLSLVLFLSGLGDSILKIDRIVGIATVVPMSCCGLAYLYYVIAPVRNPQLPYRNPFSDLILPVIQSLRCDPFRDRTRPRGVRHERMEARQERLVMEEETRKKLDVHALQWLVHNMDRRNEMETFILAIPGILNQKWGGNVWAKFCTQGNLPFSPKGTIVGDFCRYVEGMFGIYSSEGDPNNKKAQRERIHGCIETVASLVCCAKVELGRFGKVREVLSDLAPVDGSTELLAITPDPLFTIRWTCLSLVAIRQTVAVKGGIQERAGSAVDGMARFQSNDGASALGGAKWIDNYLKTALGPVEDLYQAFDPWDQGMSVEESRPILEGHEPQISELERIANEAHVMESVDWRISLLQETMDKATDGLTRRLPVALFNNLKSSGPMTIAEAFNFPSSPEGVPITPQFIFPRQQVQTLCTLVRGLRDIIEDQNRGEHEETLKSLESLNTISIPSRQLKDLMMHQLWRLQDLRDGGGLGFTVELLFLTLRQLRSTPSSPELKRVSLVFYTGAFEVITSGWENIEGWSGTQQILLNLICDLVIKDRGLFSNFPYPDDIVKMLLDLVENMVKKCGNAQAQIRGAVDELRRVSRREMNTHLHHFRDEALSVLRSSGA
jgi:hypothetical protein